MHLYERRQEWRLSTPRSLRRSASATSCSNAPERRSPWTARIRRERLPVPIPRSTKRRTPGCCSTTSPRRHGPRRRNASSLRRHPRPWSGLGWRRLPLHGRAVRPWRSAVHIRQWGELYRCDLGRRTVLVAAVGPATSRVHARQRLRRAHRPRQRRRLRTRLLPPADRRRQGRRHRPRDLDQRQLAQPARRVPRGEVAGPAHDRVRRLRRRRHGTLRRRRPLLHGRLRQRAPHQEAQGALAFALWTEVQTAVAGAGGHRGDARPTPPGKRRCSTASPPSAGGARGSPTRSSRLPTARAGRPRRPSSTLCSSTRSPARSAAHSRTRDVDDSRGAAPGVQHRHVRRRAVVVPRRFDRPPRRQRHRQRRCRAGRPAGVVVGGIRDRGGLLDRGLRGIVADMAAAATAAGVAIVTGDTKVVGAVPPTGCS